MAKKRTNRRAAGVKAAPVPGPVAEVNEVASTRRRYKIVFRENENKAAKQMMSRMCGVSGMAETADSKDGTLPHDILNDESVLCSTLGVAITDLDDDQIRRLKESMGDSVILDFEPERTFHALGMVSTMPGQEGFESGTSGFSAEYLRGYRDGIMQTMDALRDSDPQFRAAGVSPSMMDADFLSASGVTSESWGLRATLGTTSGPSGRGAKVAILDTGFDFLHPDFQDGRIKASMSFVDATNGQDRHGHGTHCTGVACGPLKRDGKRYGMACEADIYIGKVLNDQGSGGDSGIIRGIEWAMRQGCDVISMSLGDPSHPGSYDRTYEHIANRAILSGTAMIAAAGNESRRPSNVRPVSSPADTPSILAVGAIDEAMNPGVFSNGGLFGNGGSVDCVAPGVRIYSSLPSTSGFHLQTLNPSLSSSYGFLDGTSMATPYVAGIAALIKQARPTWHGFAVMNEIMQHVKALNLPARDVGKGLVQAPARA